MKKYWILAILCLLLGQTVSAQEIAPADLAFTPAGGGKFIYCNNEEGLTRTNLADTSSEHPSYLMNNEGLTPDQYRIYVSHVNCTTLLSSIGTWIGKGFDVDVDVQMTAKTDTVLTISKTGFEVPEISRYYANRKLNVTEAEWGCMNACADILGDTIYQLHSNITYTPKRQRPVTMELKAGETVWLSEFIENYRAVPYLKPIHFAADFEIVSGSMDVNVAAFKTIGDRSALAPDAAFGTYKRDRMQKGIADTLPKVDADVAYTIDDTVQNQTYLPVTVYNQYVPEGNTINEWYSHANPQDDPWAKTLSVESDILCFRYYDKEKLSYYGSAVPDDQKDAVWVFDTKHSDTKAYDGPVTGYTAENYIPNYPLSVERDNYGYGCSIGNYGVSTNYHVTIDNTGSRDRYFKYYLTTTSNVIVTVKTEKGTQLQPAVSKGYTDRKTTDMMACVKLPANQVTAFVIEVILPVNYYGGLKNSFQIADEKEELAIDFNQPQREPYITNPIDIDSLLKRANKNTKKIFAGNEDRYEVIKTDEGYMARWAEADGRPNYFSYYWSLIGDVYFLTDKFSIINSHYFGSQPVQASYARGKYYVRTIRDGSFYSEDSKHWTAFREYELPVDNGGLFAVAMKNGAVYASQNGIDFYKINYQLEQPSYMQTINGLYYYTNRQTLGVSADGVYWEGHAVGEPIESIRPYGKGLIINDTLKIPVPNGGKQIIVQLNKEILGFDQPPVIEQDRALVPMRHIFEVLGMQVEWNQETKTATAQKNGRTIAFTLDSDIAVVDGIEVRMDTMPREYNWRTMIPLRFLSETLGYTVTWDEQDQLIGINTK